MEMELNEIATMHIANQEILILNDQCTWSSKTQPNTVTCRTSTRT